MGLKNLISKITARDQESKAGTSIKSAPDPVSNHKPLEDTPTQASSQAERPIRKDMTMREILNRYPSAQRALFQRYHVGGCSSCGFDMADALEDVCKSHNILSVDEAIDHIIQSDQLDQRIQIGPQEAAQSLKTNPNVKLIDVRDEYEHSIAHIEGAQLISQSLVQEMMTSWPKDTPIIFHCHHGIRSLDAASYFLGHGFTNVKSLKGGIDAWSQEVDPSVRRY